MTAFEPETVGVLVVDDDPLVRAGLVMMLGGAPDIRVVAEAGDGTQVLPLVDRHAPDVVPGVRQSAVMANAGGLTG